MGFDPTKLPRAGEQTASGFDPSKLPSAETAVANDAAGSPEAGDFDFGQSARSTARYVFDHGLKQQIIPTAASLAATRLPALVLGGPAGLIAAPLMEAGYQGLAGYLGEKANQATGITPLDNDTAALQGGIAGLTAGVTKGVGMGREFAGRRGAVRANQIAETEARRTVAKHTPLYPSKSMFDEAAQEGATVPMPETHGYVSTLVSDLMRNDSSVTARNLKSKLQENYGSIGGTVYNLFREGQGAPAMSADKWQWHHMRLGAKLGAMKDKSSSSLGQGEGDQLYARMMTDIEQQAEREVRPQNTGIVRGGSEPVGPSQGGPDMATVRPEAGRPQLDTTYGVPQSDEKRLTTIPPEPSNPSTKAPNYPPEPGQGTTGLGATKLLKALRTYRDEKSIERIQNAIESATKVNKGQGGDVQFNAQEVIKNLKADRFYPKAFGGETEGAGARREIEDLLRHLNTAPNLPAPGSVNAGSKRIMERITAAGALGAAGASTLGWKAAAVGAAGGLASKDIAEFSHNLAFAMRTKTGRSLVKELAATKSGMFSNRNLSVLSSYVTALQHDPDSEMAK